MEGGPMPAVVDIRAWLGFCSAFVWQLIIVGVLIYFRKELEELLKRVAHVGFGPLQVDVRQPPAPDATSPGGKAEKELKEPPIGQGGFFTVHGIRQLIADSGLIGPGEKVERELLIFQTEKQRTWLVTTDKQMFCILDDEQTRQSGRMIQWRQPLAGAKPVRAKPYQPKVGLLDIGERKDWLYSVRLHPSRRELEAEIGCMISDTKT
jgi:hypothetical protein